MKTLGGSLLLCMLTFNKSIKREKEIMHCKMIELTYQPNGNSLISWGVTRRAGDTHFCVQDVVGPLGFSVIFFLPVTVLTTPRYYGVLDLQSLFSTQGVHHMYPVLCLHCILGIILKCPTVQLRSSTLRVQCSALSNIASCVLSNT